MDDADRERLASLFDARQQSLFRFAVRVGNDRDTGFDLLQEALLRAARNAHKIPADDEEALAWLFRIIVNLARDRHRRDLVRRLASPLLGIKAVTSDPRAALVARIAIRTAMETLPPRQRAVIALCELDELPVTEVARILGISGITVRWHLSQARKRLALTLGGPS